MITLRLIVLTSFVFEIQTIKDIFLFFYFSLFFSNKYDIIHEDIIKFWKLQSSSFKYHPNSTTSMLSFFFPKLLSFMRMIPFHTIYDKINLLPINITFCFWQSFMWSLCSLATFASIEDLCHMFWHFNSIMLTDIKATSSPNIYTHTNERVFACTFYVLLRVCLSVYMP